jgi:hypothetical protein
LTTHPQLYPSAHLLLVTSSDQFAFSLFIGRLSVACFHEKTLSVEFIYGSENCWQGDFGRIEAR